MVVVTSTTGSKAINTLVGISARVPSSRDKIGLEEVEGALIEHLPLINLREKGLEVLLAPFLPLSRYSMNKVKFYALHNSVHSAYKSPDLKCKKCEVAINIR